MVRNLGNELILKQKREGGRERDREGERGREREGERESVFTNTHF